MLTLDDQPFSQGHASYFDRDPARTEQTAKIYVQVEPEGLHSVILAQLDTGAPWSILDREIATAIDAFEAAGEVTKVSARSGTYEGKLVKLRVTLLATAGASLDVDATVFVSSDWPWGTFIGYGGFLQSIRFAIDPSTNSIYFGTW